MVLTPLLAFAGVLVALFAVYQVTLSIAALFYHRPRVDAAPRSPASRLVVLIPAYNEAGVIERCVASLQEQSYPRDRYRILVVADNCTDETAAVAAAAGAEVLIRDEPAVRGKGRALRWAMDRILAPDEAPDAIVVVDADSFAERDFLRALTARLEDGADAVQSDNTLVPDDLPASRLRATAFFLVNRVRPAGRAALGLPGSLSGTGMLLSHELLLTKPWEAFTTTEDVEYSTQLRLAGIRTEFAPDAILRSETAPNPKAAAQQQLRWEAGKLIVARTYIPKLMAAAVRQRRISLLESAFELAVPPLGILTAFASLGAALAGFLVGTGAIRPWALLPWLIALAAIPLYVLIGLRAARAPAWAYRSLVRAPWLVLTKVVRLPAVVRSRQESWVRTERRGE
jgi:1,2-diacylglycerol 3-beta-glucosyltransferase